MVIVNSFLASDKFRRMLMIYANSSDPGQAQQNVGPDLHLNV